MITHIYIIYIHNIINFKFLTFVFITRLYGIMIVNGKEADLQAETTLLAYLESNGYDPRTIAVEKNGAIVPKGAFASETLSGGDTMEIVAFMGGGGR